MTHAWRKRGRPRFDRPSNDQGTPEQQARGREALVELRRKLHSILAEPDQSTDESTDEAR